jgi:hypothetical protein
MAHLHALPKEHEFEGYRIERVLGAGGFGITYLATETMIGRAVAIKEFLPSSIAGRAIDSMSVRPLVPADAEMFRWGLKRFRNEARTLVSFHHPHIVQVFRYFEANGTAYLVMAYEEGATLAEIIKTRRTLPEAELRAFLDPLLDGVAQVHKAEFLHRDIKPANIVIRRNGGPVLIDFGAARQSFGEKSQSAHAIVSAGYAPFEQYTSGGEQGPWTDIYALGATLYCCVTGTRPIEAPDRVAGAPMRSASEVAAGQYSDGFLRAIDHALALYPEERPRSIAAWRAELAAEPAPPTLPTLPPQIETAVPATAPARATRRALQFGLAAAAAALVCGGGYALVSAHVAEERARAEEEGRRRAKAEEDERRRKEEAGRAEEQQKRAAAARARAEAAAGKGREAQGRAQAEGRAAVAARQQAQTAGDCARKAAGRGRSGATGYYTGQLTDGSRYEGQVNAQKYIDGCGVKTMTDKRRFEGQMSAGKVHGYVVFIGTDGRRFEGTYVSGDVNGYGVHRYPSGDELYGRFVGLNVDGAGVWIQNDGARYEGEFRSSRWWGFGVIRERNGTIYEGEFIDGMRHGLGVQTTTAGEKTHGRWEKGVYKGVE